MLIGGRWFLPEHELRWQFVAAPGPGGQKVNKTASSVRLVFPLRSSTVLEPELKARLLARLSRQLTAEGELLVVVHESRSQWYNRQLALAKLAEILERALVERKVRRPTRPTAGSIRRRLADKAHHARLKRERGSGIGEE